MGFADYPWADTARALKGMLSAQDSPKTRSPHRGDLFATGQGIRVRDRRQKDKGEGKRNKEKGKDFCPWETPIFF